MNEQFLVLGLTFTWGNEYKYSDKKVFSLIQLNILFPHLSDVTRNSKFSNQCLIESLYHNLRDFHQIFKRRNGKIFLIFFFLKNYISHKITSKAFLRFPNFSNLFPLLTTQDIFVFKNLLSILPLLSVPINGDSVFVNNWQP